MAQPKFEWEDNDENKPCSECKRVCLEQILVSRDTYGRIRKIVCSEACRQEFDHRYWNDVVERKKMIDETKQMKSEYTRGFKDAMTCYAWWKDSKEYVGSTGRLLREELGNLKDNPYYKP